MAADNNTNPPEDRLAVIARNTSDEKFALLTRQSLGRPVSDLENLLAEALMDIYGQAIFDYDAVVAELTKRGVVAPISQQTEWTEALLLEELAQLNASFDKAYEGNV